MDSELFMLLSGALTFGVPLALAARELLVLRRVGDGPSGHEGPRVTPPAPPPVGNKPLPDCLIPRPMPRATTARSRALEDA